MARLSERKHPCWREHWWGDYMDPSPYISPILGFTPICLQHLYRILFTTFIFTHIDQQHVLHLVYRFCPSFDLSCFTLHKLPTLISCLIIWYQFRLVCRDCFKITFIPEVLYTCRYRHKTKRECYKLGCLTWDSMCYTLEHAVYGQRIQVPRNN